VRPLKLSVTGLRSYRRETSVDFTGAGLIAIVGDTGAGKSSLLEAMTYALYNGTTWNARDVKALISDGAVTMSVVLEFSAGERVYRVHRSTSRAASPPSVHTLECVSDPKVAKRDGEAEVSAEIERLVGMNRQAFLSAVILPQGDFQTLLEASPADRTRILKGIFRLDTIDEMRLRADAMLSRSTPLLDRVREERARLPENPAALMAEAAARRDEAARLEKKLLKAQADVRKFTQASDEQARRAAELKPAAERLASLQSGAAKLLADLVPLEKEQAEQEEALAVRVKETAQALAASSAKLEKYEKAGESTAALYKAGGLLDQVETELRERVEEPRARLAEAEKEMAKTAAGLEKEAGAIAKLKKKTAEAEGHRKTVEEQCRDFMGRLSDARGALRDLRTLEGEWTALASALEASKRELAILEGKMGEAAKADEAATLERNAAAETLEAVRRLHAAAHAAQGLSAGDPCPVCTRVLPKGFAAPVASDEEEARRRLVAAEEGARAAHARLVDLKARLDAWTRSLDGEKSRAEALGKRVEAARSGLAASLGAVDLALGDDVILAPLLGSGKVLEDELTAARATAESARQAETKAQAELDARSATVERERKRLEGDASAADAVEKRCRESLATLPPAIRPASAVTSGDVPALREALAARLAVVEALAQEKSQLQKSAGALSEETNALGMRRESAIEAPRRRAEGELNLLLTRLNDGLECLGERPLPEGSKTATLLERSKWAKGLEDERGRVSRLLETARGEAAAAAAAAREQADAALASAGFRTPADLDGAHVAAAAARLSAEKERATAEKQAPIAAELDRRLGRARDFVDSLRELQQLLNDGRFIGYVINQRQRNLLAVASETLGGMTGGRYGFSPEFQVVDRVSNQPRSTKTLSGGESFLASLALALGLVEIAGRTGGRLDALFLDEGFGALDANSLDEALSALENRAAGGRLVAVVSHLKAVAERIDSVLVVRRSPSGSVVHWANAADKSEMLQEEIGAGLLS
jgi:exonuclease SbcC